jgi:hypothetical protein
MNPTDVTIEILKSIRDEVRETRTETNARLDNLSRRVVESEMRTATAIVDLHGTVRDMVDVLRAQHDLRPRLDHAERDITEIKHRLGM